MKIRTFNRLALLALLPGLALAGPNGRPKTKRCNIVLITVESLRSDRLGCYSGGKGATPAIDALAARGLRFDRAYAASPSTVPSIASILTGLYPTRHGIRHDLGGRLRENVPTLALTLKENGYRTGAVVGSFHLDSDRGLDLGFDLYDDHIKGIRKEFTKLSKERPADEVVRLGLEFLDAGKKRKPFFLWLDLYDPHYDYAPPKTLAAQFEKDPYLGEVAQVDAQVGALLEALRARRLETTTNIILAASHGEGLGDHGETGHGVYLYETTIRVPLIFAPADAQPLAVKGAREASTVAPGEQGAPAKRRGARREGLTVTSVVGLIDLVPTIHELVGIANTSPLDGRSFARFLWMEESGEEPLAAGPATPYFIEAVHPYEAYGWSPLFAVVAGDRKVVQGQRLEAFDLKDDPKEAKPIQPTPSWAADLEAVGRPLLGSLVLPVEERQKVLDEVVAMALPWTDSLFCLEKQNLPDPRDRVPLNDSLFRARLEFDQGHAGTAAKISEEVLESDPTNFTALEMASILALRTGWRDVFLEHMTILQCDYPFRGTPYHYLGHYYLNQGNLSAAEKSLLMFARLEPWREESYYELATLYAAQGRADLAFDSLKKAIASGAHDFEYMRKDPLLRPLRGDRRFSSLLGSVAAPAKKNP